MRSGRANKDWSRKTLVLQPCELHLANNTTFYVRGTTQSGKLLLEDFSYPFHFLCYDLQSNDMRNFETREVYRSTGLERRMFTDVST